MVKLFYMNYPVNRKRAFKNDEKFYSYLLSNKLECFVKQYKYFSNSHCPGYVIRGFADYPIGCDVEQIRRFELCDLKKGLGFFLDETEKNEILRRKNPYLDTIIAWTRKESYYKASHNRIFPSDVSICDKNYFVRGSHWQFSTIQPTADVVITCCHHSGDEIEYNKVII